MKFTILVRGSLVFLYKQSLFSVSRSQAEHFFLTLLYTLPLNANFSLEMDSETLPEGIPNVQYW